MKFRVTYWPGTANFPGSYVAWLSATGAINTLQKQYFTHHATYKDAQNATIRLMDGPDGSDGCLIEYAKQCVDCGGEFYTRDENAIRCPDDAKLLLLA